MTKVYTYKCTNCSTKFDDSRAVKELDCPKCGREAKRYIHVVPVIFKGSGFYSTDNKGK